MIFNWSNALALLCLHIASLFNGTGAFASVEKPIRLVTSTTDLAYAARQVGGNLVAVESMLGGPENPHFVDARPNFIRMAANAQIVCLVGLGLEVGWLPKVLAKSGNSAVQPGGKGYCETGKSMAAHSILEKPTGPVDRSMGDVHPHGNPHFWLSPVALAEAAEVIKHTLVAIDRENALAYMKNYNAFVSAMATLQSQIEKTIGPRLKPGNFPVFIEYHKDFAYYAQSFGLISFGSIEEKPGISPSAGRIAQVAQEAKAAGVKFGLASENAPKKILEKFTQLSGIPIFVVAVSIQKNDEPSSYAALLNSITQAVLKGLGEK